MHESLLKFFSFGTIVVLILSIIFVLFEIFKIKNPIKEIIKKNQLAYILLVALGATTGSVLLSTYFKLAPCDLCWYQRMFLFPIPVIALIAFYKKDYAVRLYASALSFVGIGLAIYHSILQAQIFKKDSVFCNPNAIIDCATPDFIYFGFVTVPIMSLATFAVILIVSYPYEKK